MKYKKYRGKHITLVCKEEYLEFLKSLNLFNTLIPINLNKFYKNQYTIFTSLIESQNTAMIYYLALCILDQSNVMF